MKQIFKLQNGKRFNIPESWGAGVNGYQTERTDSFTPVVRETQQKKSLTSANSGKEVQKRKKAMDAKRKSNLPRIPIVSVDPSGGYHAYSAENFWKDQTGEEMPLELRPTAEDNLTVANTAAASLFLPQLIGTMQAAPLAGLSELGGSILGDRTWDLGSRAITGNSWSENLEKWTGIPKEYWLWANPGTYLGGVAGPYKARVAFYNNKSPFGYSNTLSEVGIKGIRPVQEEVMRGVADWLNPFGGWRAKKTPYWKAILQNSENANRPFMGNLTFGSTAEFRDMMQRLALKLPENSRGNIFTRNADGTYGIDVAKRNAINKEFGGGDWNNSVVITTTPKEVSPGHFKFGSGDSYAGVGGNTSGEAIYNPSTGGYTVRQTDVYDINPFEDPTRTVWKWGTEHVPSLRKFEAMTSVGGQTPKVVFEYPSNINFGYYSK